MSNAPHAQPQRAVRKAVVPAAGFGTRLRPLTNAFPKELLPIGRKPVLAYVVEELRRAGIEEALFVVSERKPQIRAFFGEEWQGEETHLPPMHCSYVIQEEQCGSGDAVLRAEEWVQGQPFVVAFGDCIIDAPDQGAAPLRRLIAAFTERQAGGAILVESVARENVWRYGVVNPAEALPDPPLSPFALKGLVEKPRVEEAPSAFVVAARFVLHPAIFDALRATPADSRDELNLPDAMRRLHERGMPLWAAPLLPGEARRDIGNFETFFANFLRFALRDPEYGEALRHTLADETNRAP